MRRLNEGPGAGYTLKGELDYPVKINSFDYQTVGEYDVDIECDIDATLLDCEFYSYYYGGTLDGVSIKITHLHLESSVDEVVDREIDEYDIRDALDGIKIEALLGGGWSHSTFDGEVTTDDIKDNSYGDFYVVEMDFYIPNKTIVSYIDKAVQGDTYSYVYNVLDDDYMSIESFDNEEDAIEFAEDEESAFYVSKEEIFESPNGEFDFTGEDEVVWQKY